MNITSKFGGTSLADADQIRKMAGIITADPRRRFVVVSAPGKRCAEDRKITDLLYLSQSQARQGNLFQAAEVYDLVRRRYLELAHGLGVGRMEEWLSEVETGIAGGAEMDWVVSRGEYLNAHLVAEFLGATFVDAADTILFRDDGRIMAQETYAALKKRLSGDGLFVVPGFYGRERSGRIRCFTRGGSDVTGAIVARAVNAEVYENWTDVSGLRMADPRIVDNPLPVAEVTYREQRELSYRGATVLHDEALFPVLEAGIPVQICNTNDTAAPGTRVVMNRDTSRKPVAGVAGRPGVSTLLVGKAMISAEAGYERTLLEILEKRDIRYEHAPAAVDTVCVLLRDEEMDGKEDDVCREIFQVLRPDRVEISRGYALIAVVGEGLVDRLDIALQILNALAGAGVTPRLVSQGVSGINLVIAGDDYKKAMKIIYGAIT